MQRLEIHVIGRRAVQRPGAIELGQQRLADVLRVAPQVLEPVAQRRHLGVAGHAHVQLGIAGETRQRKVGRSNHCRARLGVVGIPAQVRLRVQRSARICAHLHFAGINHVPQAAHRSLRAVVLGQHRHAVRDALHGPLCNPLPLAPREQVVGVQSRPERLRLRQAQRHLLEHPPVRAAHQDAHPLQPGQVVRHLLEPAHEEVAHRDIRPSRAGQHLLQPRQQRGIGRGMEDVHQRAVQLYRDDAQAIHPLEVSAVVGEQGQVMVHRSRADQEVEVIDEAARGPQPTALPGKNPTGPRFNRHETDTLKEIPKCHFAALNIP